ncbi:MAG: universal stress protein [bacterium]|nr:universal stress protein [bacterium]
MDATRPLNILVPTDFSADSEHALRYAASLGERFGANLHLLHVITLHKFEGPMDAKDLPGMEPLLQAADTAARTQLDAGATHGGEAEARVVKVVERGVNAWDPIIEYARREPIDLVVIARRSGSALSRFLLGSVTERVLRFAPCPVLLVEKGDRDFVDPKTMATRLEKVVVGDDLTDKTSAAMRTAATWLTPYRPEMHLVHAIEIEVPAPYVMGGVKSVFTLDPTLKDRVTSLLQSRSSEAIPDGWSIVTGVREGKAHKVLSDYAADVKADLLVVAGESRIDLAERVLGGAVERIARHAPCPMLMI